MLKLLISEKVDNQELLKVLRGSFTVTEGDFTREELIAQIHDADVLWVKLRHHLDRDVLDRAARLRWIATPTTGLNHIDMEYAASRGIEVVSLRGETDFLRTIRATAELTVGLTLSLLRNIPAAVEQVRAGKWNRDEFVGTELYGKTFGIVGLGRLGSIVAQMMQVFGMTVIACDPHPAQLPPNVELVTLIQIAERADIISVHASYEPSTQGLLNRDFFQRVKSGAVLVNTARGEIIDETALVEALDTGRLAGTAVDVVINEHRLPNDPGPLARYALGHDNVIITPHIGGNTKESRYRTDMFLAQKLIASCSRAASATNSREA